MQNHSATTQKNNYLTTLKKHFGYDVFRPLQKEIIAHVMQEKDALVLMPTGGGKSICFQLPALLRIGMTVVISPLISLMKDQVDTLTANGIPAAYMNSTLEWDELQALERKVEQGIIKLLYLAPERLAQPQFREWLERQHVSLIAIDEAHCISEWGHDFRPDYRNLIRLRRDFPQVPLLALTATATPQVQQDIIRQLALRSAQVFASSFNRPNLHYSVRQKQKTFDALAEELQQNAAGSTIIYCFSRKGTEDLAARLNLNGFIALPYHAGLSPSARHTTQEKFIRDEVKIIVATIAFGMGIDKPDVRLIVHYDLPKSVEGYYQETGRAGRDGLPSRCVLFYSYGDTTKHRFFIRKMEDRDERDRAEEQLLRVVQYAEKSFCRRHYLLQYFGENPSGVTCTGCDVCFPMVSTAHTEKTADPGYDQELFTELRQLRKRLADARGVPPFVIFGDRSLHDMARYYPQSLESFGQMHGVGQSKRRDFGQVFVAAIQKYAKAKNIFEKMKPVSPVKKTKKSLFAPTHEATRRLIQQKLSLQEIMRRRGLAASTVLNHIEALQRAGADMDIDHLRPNEKQLEDIAQAFRQSAGWNLAPVKQILGGTYSYEELRLARIFLLLSASKRDNKT